MKLESTQKTKAPTLPFVIRRRAVSKACWYFLTPRRGWSSDEKLAWQFESVTEAKKQLGRRRAQIAVSEVAP